MRWVLSQSQCLRPPRNKSPSVTGHFQRLKSPRSEEGTPGRSEARLWSKKTHPFLPHPSADSVKALPRNAAGSDCRRSAAAPSASHGQRGGAGRVQWHFPRSSINAMMTLCHGDDSVSFFGLWLTGSSRKRQEALQLLRHLQTIFQLDGRARERICIL